jgi:hypothetical protein
MVSSHTSSNSLSARFRARRMRYLDDLINASGRSALTLADLGGTLSFWQMNLRHLRNKDRLVRIDLFNLEAAHDTVIDGIPVQSIQADITQLAAIPDGAYDVAFSNSALEHVGNLAEQGRFASEICRMARVWLLQTPNRFFPLEPHFYFPFFALLPLAWRAALHQHFRLGWLPKEPDPLRARTDCEQIRLLSFREIRLLFPRAIYHRERCLGLTKSFIVSSGEEL